MSEYRQTAYVTPFSGALPPLQGATSMDDDFNRLRPNVVLSGQTLPYVTLDPKWQKFDPGVVSPLGTVIVPRAELGLITTESPLKQWTGYFQNFPAPTALAATHQAFYARMFWGPTTIDPDVDLSEQFLGMFIADDMSVTPESASMRAIGFSRVESDGSVFGSVTNNDWVTYDGGPLANGGLNNGWPSFGYFRIRMVQTYNGPDAYGVASHCECSTNGLDWLEVGPPIDEERSVPYESVGFGIWGSDAANGYIDLFRARFDADAASDTGGILGSVMSLTRP